MMRIALVLVILLPLNALSQYTFFTLVDTTGYSRTELVDMGYDPISGNMYTIENTILPDRRIAKISQLDSLGQLLKIATIGESGQLVDVRTHHTLVKRNDSTWMVPIDYSFENQLYAFIDFGDSVNVDINFQYEDTSRIQFNQILDVFQGRNGTYVAQSESEADFTLDMSITKYDDDLNKIWEFYVDNLYSLTSLTRFTKSADEIVESKNGNLIVLGANLNRIRWDTPKEDWYRALYLAKIDSTGQLIEEIEFNVEEPNQPPHSPVLFQDSLIAFSSSYMTERVLSFYSTPRFIVADLKGNIIDSTWIGTDSHVDNGFYHIEKVEDGFIAAGQIYDDDKDQFDVLICKFSFRGKLIWQSRPVLDPTKDVPRHLRVRALHILEDEAILIGGQYDDDLVGEGLSPQPFVARLDKFGCLEPGCQVEQPSSIVEVAPAALKISPNPASEYILVETEQEGRISVYSLSGSLLLRQEVASGTTKVNLSAQGLTGMVVVEFVDDDGRRASEKVVLGGR